MAGGEALLVPAVTTRVIAAFAGRPAPSPTPQLAELTPREAEVLRLMARGLSNAEIATALTLGEATVKTHVARVLMKLGLRDRVQAVVFAYESGLIRAGDGGPTVLGSRGTTTLRRHWRFFVLRWRTAGEEEVPADTYPLGT